VFTNNKQLINEVNCQNTQFSDHKIVEIATHFKSHFARTQNNTRQRFNAFDGLNFFSEDIDWAKITEELSTINWENEFHNMQPDDKIQHLIKKCEYICTKHVPQKRPPNTSRKSKIPRDRRILMRRRRKVTKQLGKNPTKTLQNRLNQELIEIELKLQKSYSNSTSAQEQKALDAIKRNPKYFFSYVKKFNKVKPSIGPLLNHDNHYATENLEMANILSSQYSSVFSTPLGQPVNPQELFNSNNPENLNDIDFSPSDIIEAIDELRDNAAPGIDGFPAIFLKKCKVTMAQPLYTIWRESLDQGITSTIMKHSAIVPIHKGDSTALAKNYRPVALTSHLVKIFEKIIRKHIVAHLESHNLLNPSQHGFRAGRSCLSQLLAHYDKILSLLEQGYNVDVIYLDFAKAFDKLDFNITLNKLKLLGIDGKIGKWIHSFLTNRTQSVIVNGIKSPAAPVLSGVPQGSVIGPILFLILIGDIDEQIRNSFLSSFADDSRIGKGIKSPEEAAQLQQDLIKVYNWAEANNMSLNATKFELLRYGNDSCLKDQTTYSSNTNQIIEEKSTVKDLGVSMSATADFKEHINKLTDTVRDLSSWILRSFKSRSKVLMLQLWKSLVIPRLDYCSQLWNPHYAYLIQQLEELQKSFIRRIYGFRDKNYWAALQELGLYSLQRRRERYQAIYLWNILESKVPNICHSDNELIKEQSSINSRRGRTIHVPTLRRSSFSSIRHHTLPFHGARVFNLLPKYLRNATNISKDVFKSMLDKYLKTVSDQPLIQGYTYSRQAPSNSLIDMIQLHYRREESILAGGN